MAFGITDNMISALSEDQTEGKIIEKEIVPVVENAKDEEGSSELKTDEASAESLANKTTELDSDEPEPKETVNEPTEEQIFNHLKRKGYELESIDDFFKPKEIPAESENVYGRLIEEDPEVKAFLDFKKETNRSFTDFVKAQENINDISLLDLAIGQAKIDMPDLSNEDLISIIEDELNIDLSDVSDLSTIEKARLTRFSKEYKKNLISEKEKYKIPAVNENAAKEEMIKMPNGDLVPKKAFEDHAKKRQIYLEETKAAVDSVAKTTLTIEFDNNGKKESFAIDYEHDAEDKKGMLSMASDVDSTIANLFRTDKGFNNKSFAKGVWRLDEKNWEKEVSAIVNKAIAENTLVMQKNENNINFNTNHLPNSGVQGGSKQLFSDKRSGFGVKFNLDTNS